MELMINKEYEYKGYKTKFEYSEEDKVFFGKLLGIKDFIIFDGETLAEAYNSFICSVEDYLKITEDLEVTLINEIITESLKDNDNFNSGSVRLAIQNWLEYKGYNKDYRVSKKRDCKILSKK